MRQPNPQRLVVVPLNPEPCLGLISLGFKSAGLWVLGFRVHRAWGVGLRAYGLVRESLHVVFTEPYQGGPLQPPCTILIVVLADTMT